MKANLLLLLLCLLALLAPERVNAQAPSRPFLQNSNLPPAGAIGCGTDKIMEQLRQNAAFVQQEQQTNNRILSGTGILNEEIVTLPVVFHIVSRKPEHITNGLVQDAVKELNDAFGKGGKYAASKGADTRIRFCLAQTDPEGGITTGITRTPSFFGGHLNPVIEDRKLKLLVQWDPQHYINIWMVDTMDYEGFMTYSCGKWIKGPIGAYATMPPGGGPLDGIVSTGFGVTLVHEMGHYLGLYHTFEGLSCQNNDCTTTGDRVCDTPPDAMMYGVTSCSDPMNSCYTDTLSGFARDTTDPIHNFMDYSLESCQNEFTKGQAERMRGVLATVRKGLLENKCEKPCTGAVAARFGWRGPHALVGDRLDFTNTSAGATQYQWLVNDTLVATSTNYSHQFNRPGRFKITLKASDANNCFATQTSYVVVNCGVTARFFTDKRTIAAKAPVYRDTVLFTNTSENAQSFTWLMRTQTGTEQTVANSKDLQYEFTEPGMYYFRLVATSGSCADTTDVFPVQVFDATQDGQVYISGVDCYEQTKVRVSFFVCNSGYAAIPAGTPIAFYDANPRLAGAKKIGSAFFLEQPVEGFCCSYLYTTILEVGRPNLDVLYAVFNDSGATVPVQLPGSAMFEKNYDNNIAVFSNFRFRATAAPVTAVLEPGDTLQLFASGGRTAPRAFRWSPAQNLSCVTCPNPRFIADTSDAVRQVLVTSMYGCFDSAAVSIKVPPYNDFTGRINKVECAANGDSLQVSFSLANSFKRGVLPKGLQVQFYRGDPFSANATPLAPAFVLPDTVRKKEDSFTRKISPGGAGPLYILVNDGGGPLPRVLPATQLLEKDYTNNSHSYNYEGFGVSVAPAQAVLEPGDTLQLVATASPDSVRSYRWSDAARLSCTDCPNPQFFADTSRTKQVVAANFWGCTDTAFVFIKVPPADDYTVVIDSVICAANDSLIVWFTINNSFRRGELRQGLPVAFFDGNPAGGGKLLGPLFTAPVHVAAQKASHVHRISGKDAGVLFAAVNSDGPSLPMNDGRDTTFKEKDYINNISQLTYQPEKVQLQPADTTVLRKSAVTMRITSAVVDPSSTRWTNGAGYTLSCTSCAQPQVVPFATDTVRMTTNNQYGCPIRGTAVVKVLPPDFRVEILETACYSSSTTLVRFRICMGNQYDSVPKGLPVSFYDGNGTSAKLLQPVFYTQAAASDSCRVFIHIVQTPGSNQLVAVVNDKGGTGGNSTAVFAETDFTNNAHAAAIIPFVASITPSDTALGRLQPVTLLAGASGGNITLYNWSPGQFLSCTTCPAPVATPQHTVQYMLTATNEYGCTDTALATVRTFSGGVVNMPNAFSPNSDGLNDVFYVMAGPDVVRVDNFRIFNRWGQQVFSVQGVAPNDPQGGWNGNLSNKKLPSENYVWLLTATLADGKKVHLKGMVLLVR
jgi:gliding motility-associated-like protein